MGMWEILEEGRGEYDRDFGMRGGNPMEEAYREGCRYGYEKAMREMQGGEMGYRNSGGSRGGSYSGGSDMGERRMPGYFPEYTVHSLTVMIWANADADAPTESSCNGEGIIPLFCQSLKIRKI